jgi:dipeptidyl aminopeptidase/acylaminoacyl peptidase
MNCPPIPVEDFCKDPAIWTVRLSPNGKKIAFLAPWLERKNLFVLDVATKEAVNVTPEIDRDIATYFWKGDRYLIYQIDSSVLRLDLESGKASTLLLADGSNVALVDDLKWSSDKDVLVAIARPDADVSDVYRINVCSDELTRVLVAEHPDVKNFGTVQEWIVNHAGEVCGAISVQGTRDYLLTRPGPADSFKIVRRMDFRHSIEAQFYPYLFYTDDNNGIYAIARTQKHRNTAALVVLSAKTGRQLRCLYHNRNFDVADIGFSHKRKIVTYVSFHDTKLRHKMLDRQMARIFASLRALPSDYVAEILDHDAAETKFIVLASNDTTPGKYYLLDASDNQNHKLTLLGDIAPWLNEKPLAPVKPVKFRARDRLPISGYLTLPVGKRAKKLPLVVCVHGGPENRNYWQYDSLYSGEVQFLANRGYAILQLNFRGSIGYGRSFWAKGFKQRGLKMQHDVTDGVRWLIRRGIADPSRIVIYGKSYGGYSALAGVAFTPELYRAAIDCAGVSNWLTWLRDFPPSDPLYPQFCAKVGDPTKYKGRLEAVAPALHADKVTKPVLIVHGEKDQDVSISESDQMVAALKSNGKTVEYIKVPNEGHIFARQESKVAFCKAMEDFLAQHLASSS